MNEYIIKFIIIAVVLLAINVTWYCLNKRNKTIQDKKIKDLKNDYKQNAQNISDDEARNEIEPNAWYAWVSSIAVCLDVWLVGAVITHVWAGAFFKEVSASDSNRALFGDSFGAVNALISAFAFAGMIVSFILQRYELKLQRKELEAQRMEFVQQNETLSMQRFENTFFNMMELQQQIVSDLKITEKSKDIVLEDDAEVGRISKEVITTTDIIGRSLFYYSFEKANHHLEIDGQRPMDVNGFRQYLRIKGLKEYNFSYTPTYFDHYFSHLQSILVFVDQSNDVKHTQKTSYVNILKATLSRYELVWIYYHGLCDTRGREFKKLVEKYSVLENLRPELLAMSKEAHDIYRLKDADTKNMVDSISKSDYVFWLTDETDDNEKYHYSALFIDNNEGQSLADKFSVIR